jgi:adenosylhomocysteine nucleosidase
MDLAETSRATLESADGRPLGIICAIPEEIAHFGEHFAETGVEIIAGFIFRRGTLDGQAAVIVETGIGKVNAAAVATLLAHHFKCRLLLFSGVAGGVDPALGIGDVVIGDRLIQHDYGALLQGSIKPYQPGRFPLPGQPDDHGYYLPPDRLEKIQAALRGLKLPPMPAAATGGEERHPVIRFGTILTGDQYVNCEATRQRLFSRHHGQAVEMEGAAVAQVAERFDLPWIVVRSLSDLAGQDSHMDFQAFAHAAAAGAARIVRLIAAAV